MLWKAKWSRFSECFCRRPGLILFLLPCFLIVMLLFVSNEDYQYENLQFPSDRFYNGAEVGSNESYLVWNPKCHMLSKDPLDPSIAKFVKKEKYEACTSTFLFTDILTESNGSNVLVIKPKAITAHPDLACCWSPVIRPKIKKPPTGKFDSSITVKQCENFKNQTTVPDKVDSLVVSCKAKAKKGKSKVETVYKNVHAILDPEKVRDRLEPNSTAVEYMSKKMSILMLGIDSVSRLNFKRNLPNTEKYLNENGWFGLQGYNKMGDNTFPNLMAVLTGQNLQQSYSRCKPTVAYKLDHCPFLWHNFRNVGYVTAYGEDETILNTFNYLKVGFVEPPTDYYLRPYMLASENLLKVKKRFGLKYCTGPQLSFERIFDYALHFARTFISQPSFGFFWTSSLSHDNMNGPSSMDNRILKKFEYLEKEGVLNESMVIFLSDHGMRYGAIRNTFVGWYEERLPFVYIWLPQWFKDENPDVEQALILNKNRLTSPFDLYETLRDVLRMSGGSAEPSSGCANCQSLFEPVPKERGCQDAGVAPHWCTCTAFTPADVKDKVIVTGAEKFLEHIESIVKKYKNKKGKRLCATLKLKKIHRVHRVIDFQTNNSSTIAYFYLIRVTPGDGKFEVTIRHHPNDTYTISDDEVSRINSYASQAKCLESGMKQYCYCSK